MMLGSGPIGSTPLAGQIPATGVRELTLAVGADSFALASSDTGFTVTRILPFENGALTVDGIENKFKLDIPVEPTSFLIGVNDVFAINGYGIQTIVTPFSLDGVNADLLTAYILSPEFGALAVEIDPDIIFTSDHPLFADAADFMYAGIDIDPRHDKIIPFDGATYAIAGLDASVKRGFYLAKETGVFDIVSPDNIVVWRHTVPFASTAFALAGISAGTRYDHRVYNDAGAFTLNFVAAPLVQAGKFQMEPGNYILAGDPATLLERHRFIINDKGSFLLDGKAAVWFYNHRMMPEVLPFALVSPDTSIRVTRKQSFEKGTFLFNEQDALFNVTRTLPFGTGTIILGGIPVELFVELEEARRFWTHFGGAWQKPHINAKWAGDWHEVEQGWFKQNGMWVPVYVGRNYGL